MEIDKFIRHSRRVETDDLDWDAARRAGLAGDEPFVLRYFADVEGQTIFYFREILNTHAAGRPEILAFMTTWNYEEFFHAQSLGRMLEACGHPAPADRRIEVRRGATLMARVENLAQLAISRLAPDAFLGLYLTWGASQELLTSRCYERLQATTGNPVLAELAARIAKQERRHFAWYWNGAREQLARSAAARRITRLLFERFWNPVGSGVKTGEEVYRLVDAVFPGPVIDETMGDIQRRISSLPGMEGVDAPSRFAARVWQQRDRRGEARADRRAEHHQREASSRAA
jgi:rubrerythrin